MIERNYSAIGYGIEITGASEYVTYQCFVTTVAHVLL